MCTTPDCTFCELVDAIRNETPLQRAEREAVEYVERSVLLRAAHQRFPIDPNAPH